MTGTLECQSLIARAFQCEHLVGIPDCLPSSMEEVSIGICLLRREREGCGTSVPDGKRLFAIGVPYEPVFVGL